ncbi:MAG: hypothetical protein AAB424_00905 [Patescibacteria group bacterium]
MAVFLGVIVVISLFVAAIALCTALVGFGAWLRWRIALLPHMRQSSDLRTWYKREKVKDDDRRNMQRMAFGMVFLIVQVPFFIFFEQRTWPFRTVLLGLGVYLALRGVYGHWLGGRARLERHVTEKASTAHHAFDLLTPEEGARSREIMMRLFTAERIIRLGGYTILGVGFVAALVWDAGAGGALPSLVLP